MLIQQENRWWSVKFQSLGSKEHFLRYAGNMIGIDLLAAAEALGSL